MHSILLVLLLGQVPAGELSIKTGDLEVTMASKAAWTITSVTFGSDKVILPMGGQGAVLAIRGGGWVGSAMKADSEQVAELSVTADGQPVTLSLPQVVTGQKVTVIKVSALASLKHTAETTFEQEGFVQHHAFEAIDDMTVTNLYAFIYSLWPQAKQWIAQPLAGERVQGEFAASKGNKPNQPVRWLAQYDPAMQKGVVAYFREPFQGKGAFHSFWDNKGYHKLFAQPATGLIAKGTKFDLTMVIRFFASPPADWEKKVQDVAQAIEQQVPPVAAPSSQSPGERLYGPDVPESGTLTLKTATYAVPMCAQRAWTIQKIEYDGKTVAHERGFYGTVMIPKNGNWWGTGHTQGGKEIVNSLKLTVDGKQQPVEIDTTVTGRKLTLLKASTIWKFKCAAEVTVTEDHVFERTQLEATEDVDLKLLYYFMHCFIPTTTTWIDRVAGWQPGRRHTRQ